MFFFIYDNCLFTFYFKFFLIFEHKFHKTIISLQKIFFKNYFKLDLINANVTSVMRIFYFFLQNRECKYESKLAVQSNVSNYPIKQYGYIKHTNQAHPLKKNQIFNRSVSNKIFKLCITVEFAHCVITQCKVKLITLSLKKSA